MHTIAAVSPESRRKLPFYQGSGNCNRFDIFLAHLFIQIFRIIFFKKKEVFHRTLGSLACSRKATFSMGAETARKSRKMIITRGAAAPPQKKRQTTPLECAISTRKCDFQTRLIHFFKKSWLCLLHAIELICKDAA